MKINKTRFALIYYRLTQKIIDKEVYTTQEKEVIRKLFDSHIIDGTLNKEVLEIAYAEYLADLQQEFEKIKTTCKVQPYK